VSIIALTSDLKHKTFAEHLNLRINKAPGIECLIHFGEAQGKAADSIHYRLMSMIRGQPCIVDKSNLTTDIDPKYQTLQCFICKLLSVEWLKRLLRQGIKTATLLFAVCPLLTCDHDSWTMTDYGQETHPSGGAAH
jgi:hypothetical protein